MTTFLWVLAVVGAWNGISLIARILYKEWSTRYLYHVIIGIWAAVLLFLEKQ